MNENIITEAKKENLPLDFITSFVSHGWEEIGNIKAQIEGINTSFKGTSKVEEILQELVDSYLICVGRLEQFMNEKDYVELPILNENIASKLILLEPEEPATEETFEADETVVIETPTVTVTIEPTEAAPVIDIADEVEAVSKETEKAEDEEPFNFFTSFDDVKIDTSEDSPYKAWMSRN